MEKFVETVEDSKLSDSLLDALRRPKPFKNFRYEIDSSDYRQQWFDFKEEAAVKWVTRQLAINGSSLIVGGLKIVDQAEKLRAKHKFPLNQT